MRCPKRVNNETALTALNRYALAASATSAAAKVVSIAVAETSTAQEHRADRPRPSPAQERPPHLPECYRLYSGYRSPLDCPLVKCSRTRSIGLLIAPPTFNVLVRTIVVLWSDWRVYAEIGPVRSIIDAHLKLNILVTISAASGREADRLDVIDSRRRVERKNYVQISRP